MNYIELINNFWRLHRGYSFSPIEIALYFYLVDVCNGLGWKNPFNQTNTYIVGTLGISEKALYNARKSLEEAGLIEFESGNGRRYKSAYFLKGCNTYNLSGDLSEEERAKEGGKGCNTYNLSGDLSEEERAKEGGKGCNTYNLSGGNRTTFRNTFRGGNNKLNKTKLNIEENTLSSIKETAPPTGVACVPSDDENIDFEERENGDTPDTLVNIPGSAVEEKEKSCAKKEKAETGDLSPETDTGGITDRLNEETGGNGTKTGKAKSPARFIKPTFEEVAAYCQERGNDVDPQAWIDYYTSNGWKVGRNCMKDWQAAVRTWERNGVQGGNKPGNGYNKPASGHDPNRGLSRGGWGPDTIELDEHERKRKYTGTL